MKYTTVFMDFDDTLVDTAQNTYDTLVGVYNDYDLGRYFVSFDDFFYNHFQPNNTKIWKQYEDGTITKDELIRQRFLGAFAHIAELNEKQILNLNKDYLYRVVRTNKLVPHAKELLDYLQPKYRIFMVSNGFADMQYTKIDAVGMNNYFDGIILSDEVGFNKPNIGIYQAALDRAGVGADEAIMIGDNYNSDIRGSKNAGIDQIWYNPQKQPVIDFQPVYVVDKLDKIKDIL